MPLLFFAAHDRHPPGTLFIGAQCSDDLNNPDAGGSDMRSGLWWLYSLSDYVLGYFTAHASAWCDQSNLSSNASNVPPPQAGPRKPGNTDIPPLHPLAAWERRGARWCVLMPILSWVLGALPASADPIFASKIGRAARLDQRQQTDRTALSRHLYLCVSLHSFGRLPAQPSCQP